MTFDQWYETVWNFKSMDPGDAAEAAWNAAMEAAAAKCDELAETFGAPCGSCANEVRALKAPPR